MTRQESESIGCCEVSLLLEPAEFHQAESYSEQWQSENNISTARKYFRVTKIFENIKSDVTINVGVVWAVALKVPGT